MGGLIITTGQSRAAPAALAFLLKGKQNEPHRDFSDHNLHRFVFGPHVACIGDCPYRDRSPIGCKRNRKIPDAKQRVVLLRYFVRPVFGCFRAKHYPGISVMVYKVHTSNDEYWNPNLVCSFRAWHPRQGWRVLVLGMSPELFCSKIRIPWSEIRAVKINQTKAIRLVNWLEPDRTAPEFSEEKYSDLKARF